MASSEWRTPQRTMASEEFRITPIFLAREAHAVFTITDLAVKDFHVWVVHSNPSQRRKVYGVLRLGRRRAPELVNERAAAWKGIGSGSSEVTLFFRFGNLSAATMPPGATT